MQYTRIFNGVEDADFANYALAVTESLRYAYYCWQHYGPGSMSLVDNYTGEVIKLASWDDDTMSIPEELLWAKVR